MKRILSSGTGKTSPKAPDKKGDFITVQKKALGNMKCGGKMKKGKKK